MSERMKEKIKLLKQIKKEIKEINHKLMGEKRKTYKIKLWKKRKRLIKQYKEIKKTLIKLHKKHLLDIWLIDLTAISIKPLSLKKSRYLKTLGKYYNDENLLIAYNFHLGYGYSLKTKYTQITKRDLAKLLNLLPKDAIVITDNRHKYVQTLNKSFTMTIERLFGWIKKPIYTQIKNMENLTISQLIQIYKHQLQKWNIITYGF
jgi:hypothetical protein